MLATRTGDIIVAEPRALARCLRRLSVRCACSTQIAAKPAMATLPMTAKEMAAMAPGDSAVEGGGDQGHSLTVYLLLLRSLSCCFTQSAPSNGAVYAMTGGGGAPCGRKKRQAAGEAEGTAGGEGVADQLTASCVWQLGPDESMYVVMFSSQPHEMLDTLSADVARERKG